MESQKHFFSLSNEVHYINCAYMSPLLRSVEEAGIAGMVRKRDPTNIKPEDFFHDAVEVRELFARLVNAPAERIALLPSVSYGMGIVIQNCNVMKGQKVITISEEFPSDVYALQRICSERGAELITVAPPPESKQRGKGWNESILEAISPGTAIVNISSVHWADGTMFDLEAIGKKTKDAGALFIVDGSQSVGALDLDITKIGVDVLLCAGYKWLLGPYTCAYGYFGSFFDNGKPLEESWLNRIKSENFRKLVNYEPEYRPGAGRYNMGEFSNFINLPMQMKALQQILEWTPASIQSYCDHLMKHAIEKLKENGFWIEDDRYRSKHLFGLRLPVNMNIEDVQKKLFERKVTVSLRGDSIRLSPHLYNDESDVKALMSALI